MILHLDADAFFASCEQSMHPQLRDKPVAVGAERGIVTAASYPAKRLGVTRGMQTWQVKQQFPQVTLITSNYAAYEDFSEKMLAILQNITPYVEAYSIDENFADITSVDIMRKESWHQIGQQLQSDIFKALHIGVSIGIAPTKTLAKIASGWHKPQGLNIITQENIPEFLKEVPIEDVWGIGRRTSKKLMSRGITSAFHFYNLPYQWVKSRLPKPFQIMHQELHGRSILKMDTDPKISYKSISKTRTFWPHTSDPRVLIAHLYRNLDRALAKARRHHLTPQNISFFLKTHAPNGQFQYLHDDIKLHRPTTLPQEVIPQLRSTFEQLYDTAYTYRATGINLHNLMSGPLTQMRIDETGPELTRKTKLISAIDTIRTKHGLTSVYLGSTYYSMTKIDPKTERVGLGVKVSF